MHLVFVFVYVVFCHLLAGFACVGIPVALMWFFADYIRSRTGMPKMSLRVRNAVVTAATIVGALFIAYMLYVGQYKS